MQIRLGIATKDTRLQGQGIDAMIASGAAPAADLPMLYRNQGALAAGLGDKAKAEAAFAKLIEIAPNDPDAMIMLAETSADAKKLPQAVALIDRAIVAKKATGAAVPETWYKRGLKLSYDAKMTPQSLKFTRDLIAAYPTTTNWRDGLLIYRDLANPDRATDIDALRLMRVTKSLNGERDFFELADAANDGGLPGETKAVLDEGIAVKMVDPNKATFKELLATAGRRATEDRKTLPGLETKANAAATGSAALEHRRRLLRLWRLCQGRGALSRGAEEGLGRRQHRQHASRHGAGAERTEGRSRSRAPRGHRPARRTGQLLAAVAVAAQLIARHLTIEGAGASRRPFSCQGATCGRTIL